MILLFESELFNKHRHHTPLKKKKLLLPKLMSVPCQTVICPHGKAVDISCFDGKVDMVDGDKSGACYNLFPHFKRIC